MSPFVGRDAEVATLREALSQVSRTGARMVSVTGEPGIGKTRLLGEFGQLAHDRGFRVLSGRAVQSARVQPFAPLLDATADRGRTAGPPHAWLPTDGLVDQEAVRDFLDHVVDPVANGLVILLDDMHWADEATIAMLAQMVRTGPPAPVLVVVAHRPRQAPVRLHSAVADGTGDLPVRHIQLGSITARDAEALLHGRHTRPWRQAIYRQSDGNPFYLETLARAATGLARAGTVVVGELPLAARMDVVRELEFASSPARTVVNAAAVAGVVFEPELVAQIAECAESDVREAMDELAGLDLVRPVASGRLITFRHLLIRQAIYEATSPGWRLAAHARAVVALRHRDAPSVALAPHVAQTAKPGDLAAVAVLHKAARAMQTQVPATAASWLRGALRLLPHRSEHDRRRVTLLVRLAQVIGSTGDLPESRDVMHEALRLLPRTPATPRAHAAAFCILVERLLSRRVEAGALARAELAAMPTSDTIGRATLTFELACVELAAGRTGAARELATRALAVARRYHVRSAQAAALALLAVATTGTLDFPSARAHLDEAATLLDSMLDSEFARSLRPAAWVIGAEVLHERWDDALRHLDRAVSGAQHSGHVLFLPQLYAARVLALQARGRLAEASGCADQAVDLAAVAGGEREAAVARIMRAWIDTQVGVGTGLADEDTTWLALPDGHCSVLALRLLAEVRLATGDVAGCLALTEAAGGDELPATDVCSRVPWYETLTRAELAAGRADSAARWADRAAAAAAALDLPGQTGLALLARAQMLAGNDPARALDIGRTAARELTAAGMVVDATRARMATVGPLAALGQLDEAYREVKAAQAEFDRYGAHRLARQAIVERRRLAARSSRRERPAASAAVTELDRLTRRERQVATLVSQGLTNRRVAQELFVTDKTVEMHLANIFAKLGVSSRAAVAYLIGAAPGPADGAVAALPAGDRP